jgi:small-conductance mechanosensitive channel
MSDRSPYRRVIWPALLSVVATSAAFPGLSAGWEGDWLGVDGRELFQQGAGTLAWLSLAWFGSRLFHAAVRRSERPVPRLLGDLVAILLFTAAVILVIGGVFHQQIGALITTSSVLVAVIGFSVRELIADFFAGLCINLERPYGLGDWLEVTESGLVGKVVEINWRATRMVTLRGITVVVPNGLIARNQFKNYSTPKRSFRVLVPVVLDYNVPVEVARRLLLAAVRGAPLVLREPPPDVMLDSFTDHGLSYLVRFWVADYEPMVPARDQVMACIHRHLRLGGVQLCHARQDVTLARAAPTPGAEGRRMAALRHVELFRALTEGDVNELTEALSVRRIPAGAAVVQAGEAGASLFVVVEGLLEVRGGTEVLATLGPGEVFGEMSLLTGVPRSATVVAATDALLFEIFDHQLRPILHRRPELAEALGAIVEQRQQANRNRMPVDAGPCDPPSGGQPLLSRIREFFGLVR